jgi:hypothetical protein
MPNFKAIHSKLPTPSSAPKLPLQSNEKVKNKDNKPFQQPNASRTPSKNLNSSFSASCYSSSSKKGYNTFKLIIKFPFYYKNYKIIFYSNVEIFANKKEARRDSFGKHNKEQRNQTIQMKRTISA